MSGDECDNLESLLQRALEVRLELPDGEHLGALRLFNGFYEGCPQLAADLYARTLVLFGYADDPDDSQRLLAEAQAFYLGRLPWLECVIHKIRSAGSAQRRGVIAFGGSPARQIVEHGVRYALDLQMNQDASFYLDTRGLRGWLVEQARGWWVLNTFAYTGSLGVAALAGGAAQVIQVDRSGRFLDLARRSVQLNQLDPGRMSLRAADFFSQAAHLKRQGDLFDCVILDPPFFSATDKGRVDLVSQSVRLVNKVRPLVRDGGRLAAINNALFLSGADYLAALERLCADGYLSIEALIPVPADVTGFPGTVVATPPRHPAPFNHPTKIVILRVKRK
ncbi:MAG: class I SAM-dependent methyltransferase [Anaerolineales bacterium]|nr:class I SAM-dependent methyltransferase [Anaerolineales bacterium]